MLLFFDKGSFSFSKAKNPAGPLAGLAGFLENAGFEPERVRDKFRLRSTCSVKKPDRASCGAARRAPHAYVWEFEPAAFRRNAGRSRQPSQGLHPRQFAIITSVVVANFFARAFGSCEFRASETRPSKSNANETWLVGSAALTTFCGKGQGRGLFFSPAARAFAPQFFQPSQKSADAAKCLPIFTSSLFTIHFSLHGRADFWKGITKREE